MVVDSVLPTETPLQKFQDNSPVSDSSTGQVNFCREMNSEHTPSFKNSTKKSTLSETSSYDDPTAFFGSLRVCFLKLI